MISVCEEIKCELVANLPRVIKCRNNRTLKSDNSFVTKGDLLCQDIITRCVQSLPLKFEIISEEIDLANFIYDADKNYVVIDPIDGTENFTSGLKEWGVSVSIYIKGVHHESLIIMPEMGISLKTGDRARKHFSRIHGLSSSFSFIEKHITKLKEKREYRITGCCVYNIYNVITGSFASFENPRVCAWDVLAGMNLALEHGLVPKVDGRPYSGEFLMPARRYRIKIENFYE